MHENGYSDHPSVLLAAIARSEDNLVSSEISDSELNSPETSQQRLDRAERTAMFGRITAFMRSQFDEYFNNRSHGPGSHLVLFFSQGFGEWQSHCVYEYNLPEMMSSLSEFSNSNTLSSNLARLLS